MLRLQISSLKQLFRNREAIFWALVFPLIFIVVFKWFDVGGSVNARIIVVDKSESEYTKNLIKNISQVEGVGIYYQDDLEKAKKSLETSEKLDFKFLDEKDQEYSDSFSSNLVLYFPKDYGLNGDVESNTLQIVYNEADSGPSNPSFIVEGIINDINYNVQLGELGANNRFTVEQIGISVNDIRYYDILVPGVLAMGIMQSGIIGMSINIANLKEKRILKRLSATPLPIWKFLLVEINSYLILNILQVAIMLLLAVFLLGANIYGSIPLIFFLSFIGSFVFLCLGFITASVTKTANAASGLSNAATTPMMFLSGVFFDRESFPPIVKFISDLLPLSPLIDGLRAISLYNKGIVDIYPEILMIVIWTVVTFVIAVRIFKFREN